MCLNGVSESCRAAKPDAAKLALQWLELVGSAKLVVDPDLHVHWANPLAREWIAADGPLAQVGNQLYVGRSQRQLHSLIGRADTDLDGICVPIEGKGAHLLVCGRRISKRGEAPFYGLTIRRTDDLDAPRIFGVGDAFKLTVAEGRVLRHLLKGLTAQSIAEQLDVSVETVRTHIRRLYAKMEVGSREALFLRLRAFMVFA